MSGQPDLFAPPAPLRQRHEPREEPAPRIAHVYRLNNGRVVVFDQLARLMEDYCGTWVEKEAAIRRDMPPTAKVHE